MSNDASVQSFHFILTAEQTDQVIKQFEPVFKTWIKEVVNAEPHQQESPTIQKYLTRNEVAGLFKISKVTLDSYCRKGLITRQKVGTRILFDSEDIKKSLQELPVKFSRR